MAVGLDLSIGSNGGGISVKNYIEIDILSFLNLKNSSNLIAGQWYLITDYQNETAISNAVTTTYRTGLISTDGNGNPLYYPDGTEITNGDPEEIYVFATSTNEVHPEGISKTFPDEKIFITFDVPPITQEYSGYDYGEQVFYFYENGENFGNLGCTVIAPTLYDRVTLDLNTQQIEDLAESISNDEFEMYLSDNDSGINPYLSLSNYQDDWELDPDGKTIIILNGNSNYLGDGFDMTILNSNGYLEVFFTSYVWIQDGDINWDLTNATQITIVDGQTEFDNSIPSSLSIELYDPINDITASLTSANENDDWSYNSTTGVLTILDGTSQYITNGFDVLNILYDGYISTTFEIVIKSFDGRILARKNEKINLFAEADYRSELFRRYKASATAWTSSATAGTLYSYSGSLYFCLVTTTTTPSSSNNKFYTLTNNYFLAGNISNHLGTISRNTATYIDYPMFDNTTIDAYTTPINVEVLALNNVERANIVFKNGINNSSITANNSTMFSSCVDSKIGNMNNVATNSSNFNINNITKIENTIFASNVSRNTLNQISTALFTELLDNTGSLLSLFISRKLVQSNIFYGIANQILSLNDFTNNTIGFLSNSKFYGYTNSNTILYLNNSNFFAEGTTVGNPCLINSTFVYTGHAGSNTFNGYCSGARFYKLNYNNTFFNVLDVNFFGSVLSNNAVSGTIFDSRFYSLFNYNIGNISISQCTSYGTFDSNDFKYEIPNGLSVTNGGTGYALNDILTLPSISGVATTVRVSSVSAGVVTNVAFVLRGSIQPAGVYSTTGGTGTGCTITVTSVTQAFIDSNIFFRNVTSNTIYNGSFQQNIFFGVVNGNALRGSVDGYNINNNQFYNFTDITIKGASIGQNIVGANFATNTLEKGSLIINNNVLQSIENTTFADSVNFNRNTIYSITNSTVNANVTYSTYFDLVNSRTFSSSVDSKMTSLFSSLILELGSISSLYQRFGSGSPEGVVTAPIGAFYSRTDGGAGTSFYIKESGTGNTGWVAK
jgi:hypothetical protein